MKNVIVLMWLLFPFMTSAETVEGPLPWTGGGTQGEWIQNPEASKSANDPVRTLRRVESYLNTIDSLVADFEQIDPAGDRASGKLFLKPPGRMRWQYDPPTPILMVSNGDTITYYDYELDQKSFLPLNDSIAGLLARDVIRFDDASLRVVDFREGAGSIRFTLLRSEAPEEGALTMVFSDNPLTLQHMMVADAMGQTTQISLKNQSFGQKLDNKLFIFEDPRGLRTRHYRR